MYYTASRDEETEREVDVYHLYNYRGDWFFIAFDHLRGEIRIFALDRVRVATIKDERFSLPPDFDVVAYFHEAFGVERGGEPTDVQIRFDAYQARSIREREWHPTQRIEEHEDGGLTIPLTITGMDEVKRWVLQYGADAEVIHPPKLRAAIADELRRAVRRCEFPLDVEHGKDE